MDIENAETIKKNCTEYARANKKAIDVLREANGKTYYKEIAKALMMHHTTVSSLLKKAEKWGLAKKISPGVYKKKAILGYMPKKQNIKSPTRTASDLIKKVAKKKKLAKEILSGFNIPSTIFSNIDRMTTAYTGLYAVENSLRALIRKVFGTQTDWWKLRVPSGVQADVTKTISITPYYAAKRKDELEYAHLGQLKEVIIAKKNWNDFLPYLKEKNKNSFGVTIDRAIPSRNAVGHCTTLQAKDLKIVDLRFEDILKMLM